MTATATAPAFSPETYNQIKHLERATAARARCEEMAARHAARATLARTPQGRSEYGELAMEYRVTRGLWDEQIRDLRRALRD